LAKKRCAVVGASGYIGGEIVRLLLSHPNAELVAVTAHDSAGKALEDVHPNLRGVSLTFSDLDAINDAEAIFLALPNGEAMRIVDRFAGDSSLIDASADFRLRDAADYERFYGQPHARPERTREFVYGLPELFAEDIQTATRVAAPGCFATAAILALHPIVAAGLHERSVVSAVTGSSGAGVRARPTTHHPFRADGFFAYEPFTHRHIPEIRQALKRKTGADVAFVFQPHSGPFVRGIFASAFVTLTRETTTAALVELYQTHYTGQPFIRLLPHSPNVKWVRGTNFCDLHVCTDGRTAIVSAAIDNVLKGGAAQAVQCFNLMHGFPADAGLRAFATNP
jgi:N-acetyl-gamma-glutamyl-phosphate reductase common form